MIPPGTLQIDHSVKTLPVLTGQRYILLLTGQRDLLLLTGQRDILFFM